MKKFTGIVIFAVAAIAVWHFALPVQKFFQNQKSDVAVSYGSLAGQVQDIERQIFAPPPLKSTQDKSQISLLSHAGVINWTNANRDQNGGLPALKENPKLDQAANAKLKDMFKQQYFEHKNPQGLDASGLAKAAGYEYIAIGENLALGNYADDQDLLQAWMDSPGHRANILNDKFREIGAAVGQGMYEGKMTWLAVQEFGRPAGDCPAIDMNLKSELSFLQAEINQTEPQLAALKNEMDASNPKTQADYEIYNQKVAQYNSVVKIFNNKVDRAKLLTEQYNGQVRAFNACAKN